jgi:hypothetical protein
VLLLLGLMPDYSTADRRNAPSRFAQLFSRKMMTGSTEDD